MTTSHELALCGEVIDLQLAIKVILPESFNLCENCYKHSV